MHTHTLLFDLIANKEWEPIGIQSSTHIVGIKKNLKYEKIKLLRWINFFWKENDANAKEKCE